MDWRKVLLNFLSWESPYVSGLLSPFASKRDFLLRNVCIYRQWCHKFLCWLFIPPMFILQKDYNNWALTVTISSCLGCKCTKGTSLRANFPGHTCGREGKRRTANQCKAEISTNVNKHWKTHAKGNDIITHVIPANQHFASTFSQCRYSNSRDVVASSPSFPPPGRQSAPLLWWI